MQLYMAVPMTSLAPHLHGVLVLVTGDKFIAGVVDTGDEH
jgi:hypothetical protein